MRVIAGDYKGRKLKAVPGTKTRPTSDKVKESIFHILGPFFPGGKCLDLFAGSGSLGIEALSRGMNEAVFVDYSNQAIRCIHDNLKIVDENVMVTVFRQDAFAILRILEKKAEKFDLILIDPPYDKININELLLAVNQRNIANDDALLYVEYRASHQLEPLAGWEVIREKAFNQTTKMTILQKTNQ